MSRSSTFSLMHSKLRDAIHLSSSPIKSVVPKPLDLVLLFASRSSKKVIHSSSGGWTDSEGLSITSSISSKVSKLKVSPSAPSRMVPSIPRLLQVNSSSTSFPLLHSSNEDSYKNAPKPDSPRQEQEVDSVAGNLSHPMTKRFRWPRR